MESGFIVSRAGKEIQSIDFDLYCVSYSRFNRINEDSKPLREEIVVGPESGVRHYIESEAANWVGRKSEDGIKFRWEMESYNSDFIGDEQIAIFHDRIPSLNGKSIDVIVCPKE